MFELDWFTHKNRGKLAAWKECKLEAQSRCKKFFKKITGLQALEDAKEQALAEAKVAVKLAAQSQAELEAAKAAEAEAAAAAETTEEA